MAVALRVALIDIGENNMSTQEAVKSSKLKITLYILVLLVLFESLLIVDLIKKNKYLDRMQSSFLENYHRSIKTHPYNVKIFNYNRNLHDVCLKYRTFSNNTIPVGDLAALDIDLKDSTEKEKNRKAYTATVHIDDMVSPVWFEITGTYEDGTVFRDDVPNFDIQQENETFEVYIDKGSNELSYW